MEEELVYPELSLLMNGLSVKSSGIYLENIFAAPDIKKQLPTESQRFE